MKSERGLSLTLISDHTDTRGNTTEQEKERQEHLKEISLFAYWVFHYLKLRLNVMMIKY